MEKKVRLLEKYFIFKSQMPTSIYVLTGCVAVIGANSFILSPIAPLVSQSLKVAISTVMLTSAAFGLGAAISALLLAHYIDRYGPQRVLKTAMAVLPVLLLICALTPVIEFLIIAQLLAGVVSGIALPAIYTKATDLVPIEYASRAIGIVLTGWTISMIVGVSLFTILADFFNWRFVYILIAICAVVISLKLKKENINQKLAIKKSLMLLSTSRIKGISPLLMICWVSMAAFYGIYGYLGDYLRNVLGLSLSINGLITFAYGLGFGGAIFLNRFILLMGNRRALSFSLILISIIYFLFSLFSSNFYLIFILLVFLGVGNHYSINLLVVRLYSLDFSKRGAIIGLHSAVTNFSLFTGTLFFGQLYLYAGFSFIAFLAMILVITGTIISFKY